QEGGAPGDRVHQKATYDRAKDGGRPRGAGPDAEGAPLRLAFEVGGDQRQRSGHQQGAGGALENPKEHQQLHVWSEPAQHGGRAKPDQAEDEHPLAAIEIGEGARENQQGAEGQEVRVIDVRLAFQDAEPHSREVAANAGQRDVDDCRVEKHDAGSKHCGNKDPAAPISHPSPPVPCTVCADCRAGVPATSCFESCISVSANTGKTTTETSPAPTSAAPLAGLINRSSRPIAEAATMKGREVACSSAAVMIRRPPITPR